MKTKFEQGLQTQLRGDEQAIDAGQSARLSAMRRQALDGQLGSARAPRRFHGLLWPATGMALASLLALGLIMPLSSLAPTPSREYLNDNFELYDDLEFYYWLADNEQGLSG
ncbi:hypothetical protein A9Q89_03240 [Gammaproteobacteria bacterium 53_120_T64]|mgnify:CR=1 FL=1|nr:hypothetical protein A9Q89_03240 [Gammaproteobacteria bacterium 53_120_T64]